MTRARAAGRLVAGLAGVAVALGVGAAAGGAQSGPLPGAPTVPTLPGAPAPVDALVQTVNDTLRGAGPPGGGSSPAPAATAAAPAPVAGATAAGPARARPARRRAARAAPSARPARPAARAPRGVRGPAAAPAATRRSTTARRRARHAARPVAPRPARRSSSLATVVTRVVKVVPWPVDAALAALVLLAAALGVRARMATARGARLAGHAQELRAEVSALESAVVAPTPGGVTGADVSVAFRPAEGPAGGGDLWDVVDLGEACTGLILGDVCGHGPDAIAGAALVRYTLRAYLAAGVAPRVAMRLAARSLDDEAPLTTAFAAVYDGARGMLTYACAGHEPPILLGPGLAEPITLLSASPLGARLSSGQRQTTLSLGPRALACVYTDGLAEARVDGRLLGRDRLAELAAGLGAGACAQDLLDRVLHEASQPADDMTVCLLRTRSDAAGAPGRRVEEIVLDADGLDRPRVAAFLHACGVGGDAVPAALADVDAALGARPGAAVVLRVDAGPGGVAVDVAPDEDPALALSARAEAGSTA